MVNPGVDTGEPTGSAILSVGVSLIVINHFFGLVANCETRCDMTSAERTAVDAMKALPAQTGVSAGQQCIRHWSIATYHTQRTVQRLVGLDLRSEDLLQIEYIAGPLLQVLSDE